MRHSNARSRPRRRAAAALAILAVAFAAAGAEARKQPRPGPGGTWVERYLTDYRLPAIHPEADSFGPPEGAPPAMPLYRGGETAGYAFDTWDVAEAVGYSRKPFHILAGIDLQGRLTGVRLAWHVEPITSLGRDDNDFHRYLEQFAGHDVRRGVAVTFDGAFRQGTRSAADRRIDGVSRVTTSSMLFADALLRSARLVAQARGLDLAGPSNRPRLDLERFEEMTWPALEADGSIARRTLSRGEIARALGGGGANEAGAEDAGAAEVELWTASIDPAGIGVHLLGRRGYGRYAVGRSLDDAAIFVAIRGARAALPQPDRAPAPFPHLQLVQGGVSIRLDKSRFEPIAYFDGEGRPKQDVGQGMFRVSAADGFDATAPWRLELALFAPDGSGASALFGVDYALPARYLIGGPAPGPGENAGEDAGGAQAAGAAPPEPAAAAEIAVADGPDWRAEWRAQRTALMVLAATLAALLVILSSQEFLVRRRRLHSWVRAGFLAWTVGWVGWAAGAQLSVLHAINWLQSIEVGFDPAFFLMEPLVFVLTAFVAVSALLWGRAAFCGWLCPFGALQELLHKAAARLGAPQIALPPALAERLTAVKYLIFVGLAGLAFFAVDLAHAASSIEPFKTAVTFRFDAPWPAVAYALALLGAGLTIERFYCRFVCPLGAGLALLGRVRMFDWLKRRAECGNPCARCESVCPVGAIRKDGAIDMNECFYCLDCQVMYHDSHRCPPLVRRRKRSAAAGAAGLAGAVEPAAPAER